MDNIHMKSLRKCFKKFDSTIDNKRSRCSDVKEISGYDKTINLMFLRNIKKSLCKFFKLIEAKKWVVEKIVTSIIMDMDVCCYKNFRHSICSFLPSFVLFRRYYSVRSCSCKYFPHSYCKIFSIEAYRFSHSFSKECLYHCTRNDPY